MPGTILRDDWQTAVTDRLQQHARDTLQAVQQANQPPLQSPSLPNPQIDPNAIVQSLQQHAQDTWQAVQQANQQAPLQGVQIDPNDVTARLQQHAQDAFQSVDQNVQALGTGLQNVQQAVQQANQPPLQQQGVDQGAVQPATPTVDRGGDLHAYARQAAQRAGIDPDIFERQIQQESGFSPTAKSPAGAQGIAQFMPATAAGMNLDPSDPYASLDGAAQLMAANLKKYGGDYSKALAAYNAGPGNVDKYGGIPPFEETQRYVSTILGNAKQAVQGAVEAGKQAVQNILPGVSQFGDKQLTNAEAYAACGPAAAVRFAQMMGRNPTLREATDLAKTVGWTEDSGMAGLQSESKLFTEMGVAHRVLGADWQAFGREAQSGNPVVLSTPGHYFTADAYDPASGAFHVGQSGLDLKGGSEWMTPAQMEQRMGALQGGLVADHPGTPSPSPISQGPGGLIQRAGQVVQQAVQQGGRAIGEGLQSLDSTIKTISSGGPSTGAGQAVAAFDQKRQDVADQLGTVPGQIQEAFAANQATPPLAGAREAIASAPVLGGALGMARGPALLSDDEVLRTPEADTARQLLEQINAKAAAKGAAPTSVTDQDVADATRMLLTSQAVAMTGRGFGREPLPAAAAETPAARMFHGTGSAFPTVDPSKVAGEDNLFGPGYYLTSDPRVAGGVVATGGEQVGPSWLKSAVKRDPGSMISSGYAQEQARHPQVLDGLLEDRDAIRQQLEQPGLSESGRQNLEQMRARNEADINSFAGPNVRSVNVPQDLNMFDMEGPVPVDQAEAIAKRLWGPDALKDPETATEVASWSTPDADGAAVYDLIRGEVDGTKTAANRVLADAGFDGIEHSGGKRIPMMDASGVPIEHDVKIVFPDSVTKVRNAISGTQGGQISAQLAARVGGAAAGGAVGYQTTPEDASPAERIARTAGGAVAGGLAGGAVASAARFRGPLEQQVLENLRQGGLVGGGQTSFAPPAQPARGPIARGVDLTKQSILSNPATHIANVIGNTIELARQPVSLALGGRSDDAVAGIAAIMRGLPEAAGNAGSALRGNQLATLASGPGTIPRSSPIFRALTASDAFTRTLGEYQGMASKANQLLRDAGMSPGDPGAAAYLASHATDLYREGTRAGAQSVFGRVASTGQGTGVLDSMFRTYSNAKEGLLASPRLRDQAVGALMDFGIPFSGVPVQMLQIGLNRLPVTAQVSGAVRAARALKANDVAGAQRAIGETGLESALQLMIGKQVADGNITGPDDPIHPNSVRVGGNWVSMNEWGAYALPMQIMASFADGYEKGGQSVPAGTPGASDVEKAANYYGPRFNAALNASLKPFQQGIPGENLIRLVSNIGQGGATAGALGLAQDALSRITVPGAARFVENLSDPVARDINRKGVSSLWEGTMGNWPGLSQFVSPKIDPTTGEVLNKARTGAGILVGGQQDVASPLTIEADRLNKAGFKDVVAPKTYPQSVSIAGADVPLKPDEQRRVTEITGKQLGALAERLNQPDYQNATDTRKAQLMQAYINAAEKARVAAVRDVLGVDELRQRMIAGQKTAGRLNVQAPPPTFTPFLSSSSQSAQEQQAVGAGR